MPFCLATSASILATSATSLLYRSSITINLHQRAHVTTACDRSDTSRIASGGLRFWLDKSAVVCRSRWMEAAERDPLLLGDFSEHLDGLRIKLIV